MSTKKSLGLLGPFALAVGGLGTFLPGSGDRCAPGQDQERLH